MKKRFLKMRAQIVMVSIAFVVCAVCGGLLSEMLVKSESMPERKIALADIEDDMEPLGSAVANDDAENEEEPVLTAEADSMTFSESSENEPAEDTDADNIDTDDGMAAGADGFGAEGENQTTDVDEDDSSATFTADAGADADEVAFAVEEEPEEPVITADFVIANVDTALNVRSGPSTDDEVIGKLYRGARAEILERGEEWTYITSGNVTGYASNDWLMFDEAAYEGLEIFGIKKAVVTADALRVRREPNLQAGILDLYEKGDILPLSDEVDAPEGWIAVDYSDLTIGYCSADYVEVSIEYDEALTLQEEAAILEAKRLEEERIAHEKAMQQALIDAKRETPETANRDPIEVTDEEAYMIAACVHMEAGNQPYEGKLAVANVIINRLLNGYWGKTVKKVIYARGQFTGVASGLLDKYMQIGPNEGCIKATAEALSGVNNIGKYMFFRTNRTADYASYKSYVIIGDHTFYKR